MYVYKNWIKGEVIEGPNVRRHWVSFSLLYPHDRMPDPRAAGRLLKHDIIVEYNKVRQNGKEFHPLNDVKTPPTTTPSDEKKEENSADHWFWMIKLTIPRRLLNQVGANIDFYDEEDIDRESIELAQDSGIDDESAYNSDEQAPESFGEENPTEQENEPSR